MIHECVEVYVDDILAKLTSKEYHLAELRKIFKRMREYELKIKPQKCAFGVSLGKLLGFIMSRRGIEVDPKEFKAIVNIPPPRKLKDLRSIFGKVQVVRRFIA